MTDLPISDELFEQLREIAQIEGRSTDEITEALIRDYVASHQAAETVSATTRDPFLLIAQAADELGARSESGSIADLSREILTLEFAEYLKRRITGSQDEADHES